MNADTVYQQLVMLRIASENLASHPSFPSYVIGIAVFTLLLLLIWLSFKLNSNPHQLDQVSPPKTREQIKADEVVRDHAAMEWAINEGLKCAVFDKKMSNRAANRWRTRFADKFGFVNLVPKHRRHKMSKLHKIKAAVLKTDLELRLKPKEEKPAKVHLNGIAQQQYVQKRRLERIKEKHSIPLPA